MFNLTTHAKHWIFSAEQLQDIKKRTNQQGLSSDTSVPGRLTWQEEDVLKLIFLKKIENLCSRLGCSYKVATTAIVYFVRFFLFHSVMDHNVNRVMFTCVCLASKVEEERRSVDHVVRESDHQVTDAEIINTEYILLRGLKFHLEIIQPLNCLTGFVADMQQVFQQSLPQLLEEGEKQIKIIMKTDAILLYPPSQIAFVALRVAARIFQLDKQCGQYTALKLKVRQDWPQLEKNFKSMLPLFKATAQDNESATSVLVKWENLRKYIRGVMEVREARARELHQQQQKLQELQQQQLQQLPQFSTIKSEDVKKHGIQNQSQVQVQVRVKEEVPHQYQEINQQSEFDQHQNTVNFEENQVQSLYQEQQHQHFNQYELEHQEYENEQQFQEQFVQQYDQSTLPSPPQSTPKPQPKLIELNLSGNQKPSF